MSFGNPVEFVRNLLNGDRQRVGNRVKKEAFIPDADHHDHAAGDVTIILAVPPAAAHAWRFDYVHYSYNAAPAAGRLTITDGVATYLLDITAAGPGWVPFDTTRWAEGAAVTITLAGGGGAVIGCLNVLGVRYERLHGDF